MSAMGGERSCKKSPSWPLALGLAVLLAGVRGAVGEADASVLALCLHVAVLGLAAALLARRGQQGWQIYGLFLGVALTLQFLPLSLAVELTLIVLGTAAMVYVFIDKEA